MGVVARSLMTVELLIASVVLLVLVATVYAKLNNLCPSESTDSNCKTPFLNGLMIVGVIVGLLGGGLASWKLSSKSAAMVDAVSQQINGG
jgi:uncharacterized membrane protein